MGRPRRGRDNRPMNRLEAELNRLYSLQARDTFVAGPDDLAQERVRAMVLELPAPARWDDLAKVWEAVQADLQLPAPAIVVGGGYQLWLSLSEAVPAAEAASFLQCLRASYFSEVASERVALVPGAAGGRVSVPPLQGPDGRWSAFVAPDLAALFADDPWLDVQPSADGQADLLAHVTSTSIQDFERAWERLRRSEVPAADTSATGAAPASEQRTRPATDARAAGTEDPRAFLLGIMNDPTVALHLRIEAAKALLSCSEGPPS